MISGFDKAVVGMKVWEKKSISLAPSEAYWEISEENYRVVEKSELKAFEEAWIKLEKWQVLPTDIWNIEIVKLLLENVLIMKWILKLTKNISLRLQV